MTSDEMGQRLQTWARDSGWLRAIGMRIPAMPGRERLHRLTMWACGGLGLLLVLVLLPLGRAEGIRVEVGKAATTPPARTNPSLPAEYAMLAGALADDHKSDPGTPDLSRGVAQVVAECRNMALDLGSLRSSDPEIDTLAAE
jgi:hypothetical protein